MTFTTPAAHTTDFERRGRVRDALATGTLAPRRLHGAL